MGRWEYTGFWSSIFGDYDKMGKRLNALGAKGWELVSTDVQAVFGWQIGTYFWFKRALSPTPHEDGGMD